MQIAPGQFVGQTENNAFSAPDTYHLTAAGIKAGEYAPVIPWHAIQLVEAWKTTGDGNWGWEEIWHLRLRDKIGNKLQVNDFAEVIFFSDLQAALNYYLQVEIDWRAGAIAADYQQRQCKWHRGWLAGRLKSVVYTRPA